MTSATFTPAGLTFHEPSHHYALGDVPLISVTKVLAEASLVDRGLFTEADREKGTRIHAAIELENEQRPGALGDPLVVPYVVAYRKFRAEAGFTVDAVEERLCDLSLHVAGRLDLRGHFHDEDRVDIVDIKTGAVPPWCGWQVAGYVRLLPRDVRPRTRRWCLQLREDATYRLVPLTKRTDEAVFLAACTVAMAKRGWI